MCSHWTLSGLTLLPQLKSNPKYFSAITNAVKFFNLSSLCKRDALKETIGRRHQKKKIGHLIHDYPTTKMHSEKIRLLLFTFRPSTPETEKTTHCNKVLPLFHDYETSKFHSSPDSKDHQHSRKNSKWLVPSISDCRKSLEQMSNCSLI